MLDAHGMVDLTLPVDRHHPLNRGRVSWWLALPGIDGGRRWFDLMGLNHGVLTGGPTWKGAVRGGGWGCVDLVGGSDQSVVATAAAGLPTAAAAAWTTAFWHRTRSYVSLAQYFGFGHTLPGSGATPAGLGRYMLAFNNHYYFWGNDADLDFGVAFDVDSAWHRVAVTCDGSTLRLYRDGVAAASGSRPGALATAGTDVTIGSHHYAISSGPDAQFDDLAIWARELSAADVRADYELSLAGYPGVLRRRPTGATTLAAATAPSFLPAWATHANTLIGAY